MHKSLLFFLNLFWKAFHANGMKQFSLLIESFSTWNIETSKRFRDNNFEAFYLTDITRTSQVP